MLITSAKIKNTVKELNRLATDNRIRVAFCELQVVHHCNLSCRSCNHLSPVMPHHFADPETVFKDFHNLAKNLRPSHIKLLGGEPLLHPQLIEVIDAVRQSGISQKIQLLTNGLLLPKMTDAFWEKIDRLRITLYPGAELSEGRMREIRERADCHHVHIRLDRVDTFRVAYSEFGTRDDRLVQRIFDTCKLAHTWRCQTVTQGHFYRCSPSSYLPRVIHSHLLPHPLVDGLKVNASPGFDRRLWRFLTSPAPLSSCHHCLGSIGKSMAWEPRQRKTWRAAQACPTESLVNWSLLETLEGEKRNIKGNHLYRRYRDYALRSGLRPPLFRKLFDRLPRIY